MKLYSKLSATLLSCAIMSGCASIDHHRSPQLSDLTLDDGTMPESGIVSIPMPEPEVKRTPERAESASLWQSGSSGFFGDQRATKVGDILTVVIDIDDEAQLKNASSRSRRSANAVEGPTLFGYENKLSKVLPGLNDADVPDGNLVDLGSSSSSDGDGSIQRNEQISLKVAVMVIRKLENGNLVIAGRQEVRVNSELRELRVAGVVRPIDIETSNSISYEKIAEARISYGGEGQLSRVQKPRYGEDALEFILPY